MAAEVILNQNRLEIKSPRRLRTAYSYFVKDKYHDVQNTLKVRHPQPIIRRLGEMWRQLPQGEREIYARVSRFFYDFFFSYRKKY